MVREEMRVLVFVGWPHAWQLIRCLSHFLVSNRPGPDGNQSIAPGVGCHHQKLEDRVTLCHCYYSGYLLRRELWFRASQKKKKSQLETGRTDAMVAKGTCFSCVRPELVPSTHVD